MIANTSVFYSQNSTGTNNKADTSFISSLIKSCDRYASTNPDSALVIGKQAITLSLKNNNEKLLAKSYYAISYAYSSLGMNDSAKKVLITAIDLYTKNKDDVGAAYCYNSLVNILVFLGNYKEAASSALSAIKIFEAKKDIHGIILSYNSIGNLYWVQNMIGEAKTNYFKALSYTGKSREVKLIGMTKCNVANIYFSLESFDTALVFYKAALNAYVQTMAYLNVATVLTNIGGVYEKMNKTDSALFYYDKSLAVATKINYVTGITEATINKASLLYNTGNYKEGIYNYKKAFELSKKTGYKSEAAFILKWMAKCYFDMGDYKNSVLYTDTFTLYNDSLINEQNKKSLRELQGKYESDKKDAEIKLLNVENDIKEKQRKFYFFTALFSAAFVVVLIFSILKMRKTNLLLKKQQKEITEKTESLNEQAAQIARYQSQMNPHFIFNAITSVKSLITDNEVASSQLDDFSKLMRATLDNSDEEYISLEQEIRYIKLYLDFELKNFSNKFEYKINLHEGINCTDVLIPPMLLQPFIENCIKHAGLNNKENGLLTISFYLDEPFLKITIKDNGTGYNPDKLQTHESKGIDITRKRIAKLFEKENTNALPNFLTIIHKAKEGTTVNIILPLIH